RSDAIVASVFVRIASYSGRMDLSDRQRSLLEGLGAGSKPFVAVLFGNPYTAAFLQKLPTMLLTYEEFDAVELAAVRALAGDARASASARAHRRRPACTCCAIRTAARSTSGRRSTCGVVSAHISRNGVGARSSRSCREPPTRSGSQSAPSSKRCCARRR